MELNETILAENFMPGALLQGPANNAETPFADNGYASTGFVILCSALVMFMTPGVGILYSGLSRSKNALTIIMLSFLAYAIVTIQWVIFGFSLSFSETGNRFIGDLSWAGLTTITNQALPKTALTIPAIVFAIYQLQFATVTVAIIFGGVAERVRIIPSALFAFIWTTLVYDPVAYWTWGAHGWIKNFSCLSNMDYDAPCQIGGLDFAGGGPVHMASGAAALAFSIFLGHRKKQGVEDFKPHNIANVFIGTAMLWFGWFGFNAGSALSGTARAGMAGAVTTIAASTGSLTWVLIDAARTGKLSGVAFCSGALAGLVGVTPASGYVTPLAALAIGAITSIFCYIAVASKEIVGVDDSLDAFGIHGMGGFIGSILTAFCATPSIAKLDGMTIEGGVISNGNWKLLGYNLAGAVAILAYSFAVTYAILVTVNLIPGFKFRQTPEDEMLGGDLGEMGEIAYELVSTNGLSEMEKAEKETA
jgi:ammonium transporter, Amt family